MVTVKSMYGLWPSEKAVEHLVVAGVVAEGGIRGVQAEEPAAAFDKVQKPLFLALGEVADIREEEGGVVRIEAANHNLIVAREIGSSWFSRSVRNRPLAFVVVVHAFRADEY